MDTTSDNVVKAFQDVCNHISNQPKLDQDLQMKLALLGAALDKLFKSRNIK